MVMKVENETVYAAVELQTYNMFNCDKVKNTGVLIFYPNVKLGGHFFALALREISDSMRKTHG